MLSLMDCSHFRFVVAPVSMLVITGVPEELFVGLKGVSVVRRASTCVGNGDTSSTNVHESGVPEDSFVVSRILGLEPYGGGVTVEVGCILSGEHSDNGKGFKVVSSC